MTLVHVSISLHLHLQVDNYNMQKKTSFHQKVNHHQSNQLPLTPFLLI